ncbi:hypothetical protein GCM10027051_01290 [Niabella terrae]
MILSCNVQEEKLADWPVYLGGPEQNHYTALAQIDTSNVQELQPVWTFHTGDSGQLQCSPIVVGNRLYGVTAFNHLFALDAATGSELWRFVPDSLRQENVNRGVAYWRQGDQELILFAYQSWLYAIDAKTGQPVKAFGREGRTSLRSGLGNAATEKFVVSTTPGMVYQNLIIMPIRVGEEPGAAPGYIQAFNILTGKLAWVFKTIPYPDELGYETWPADAYKDPRIGGANNWAGMALDRKRGIVYIPTGSASFDFYGGNRIGSNLFANCILALDAATGNYIWHYQTVRHDIWDRDLPAPPNLLTIRKDKQSIDVVAQVTKSGYVFVLNRETGQPVFPVDERTVPASVIPGEQAWPTQPVPRLPLPFARQQLREQDITPFSKKRDSLLELFRQSNSGPFQPLSLKNTLLFPGADGGAEWGGAAVDLEGIMYVNANEMAWLFSLRPADRTVQNVPVRSGQMLYQQHCAVCHQANLKGYPQSGYPDLRALKDRKKKLEVKHIIKAGKGMMPGFTTLSEQESEKLIGFLWGEEKSEISDTSTAHTSNAALPYLFNGYNKFLDENGRPAISPPWGTLTAIDLNTGARRWQIPLGEDAELAAAGIPATGIENYGGPLVTAGGLVFIAATKDGLFRAFDRQTGQLRWTFRLPAPGFATPISYTVAGQQYIVIACGGSKLGTPKADVYMAFSLSE